VLLKKECMKLEYIYIYAKYSTKYSGGHEIFVKIQSKMLAVVCNLKKRKENAGSERVYGLKAARNLILFKINNI